MKFRWKPPFFHSTGQFDLIQTNSNFKEIHGTLLIDKHMKASYRSLTDEELYIPVPGSSKNQNHPRLKDIFPYENKSKPEQPKNHVIATKKQHTNVETSPPQERRKEQNVVEQPKNNIIEAKKHHTKVESSRTQEYIRTEQNVKRSSVVDDRTINKDLTERERILNQKRFGVSAGSTDILDRQKKPKQHVDGDGSQQPLTQTSKDVFPKYEKSIESEELIKSAIMNNEFLREGLSDKEVMQAVVDAMYTKEIPEGSNVITEGEIGSHLYVCAEGLIGIYKGEREINTLGPGRIFGELALLYNTKRNATVKAITPCTLWVLDRGVFNQIVKRVETRRIEEHVKYLRSVPILTKLDGDVLKKMTDLLKMGIFPAGSTILKQGEEGDLFYIITVGTVVVSVKNSDGSEKPVGKLGKGDFFGEGALIAKDKRTATVTAQTHVECLTLDREPFIQFLGGLEEVRKVLKSRVAKLKQVEEKTAEFTSEYSHIKLQDLDVIGTLGIGGFGRVELVQYKKDRNLTFALKRLPKNHIVAFQQQGHVLNEKNTMFRCQSPFIAKLYNTYKNSKYLYFLMEACLGGDVWSLLQKKRFFEEKTAKFITACVVEAFQHLHDRGIVYRDLKPENLLFDAKGYVKLVDFGFAKKLNPTEKTWTFAGTPEYLAPEIVRNKGHDRAVDYWALGVFIYELLVGKPPFRGADDMATYHLILKGISSTPFPKFISKPAEILIKKLCKDEPTERLGYQKDGIDGIKNHKWFTGFKWEALQKTKLPAPYVPKISGSVDLSNFEECPKDKEDPPDEFGDWDMSF